MLCLRLGLFPVLSSGLGELGDACLVSILLKLPPLYSMVCVVDVVVLDCSAMLSLVHGILALVLAYY